MSRIKRSYDRSPDKTDQLSPEVQRRLAVYDPAEGKIDLSRCNITTSSYINLVNHLATLHDLHTLDISFNSIGEAGARAIAEKLTTLTTLDIRYNSIGDAGARAIAEKLTTLTTLDISNNSIGDAGARAIAEKLTTLTTLDISNNSIGDAGARAIAEKLTTLTTLDISYNSIGEAGARAIAEKLTTLTTLDISFNSIGEAGARAIAEKLTTLTTLDISNNSIGEAGARAIAEKLTTLTTLDISFNSIGDAGARAIAEKLTTLTTLNIRYNDIGEAGARAIAEKLTTLTTLDISFNSIGEAGARAIAEKLTTLTTLDISGNSIGEAGARAIAEKLTTLTTLDISGNSIGEAGARAIAEKLTTLTTLNISYNDIGEAGARAIAEKLTTLTTLNISYNSIGEAGARAIAEKLTTLTTLYISGNSIGDAGARAIAEKLTTLTTLDISDNSIGDAGARAIAEKLTTLTTLDISDNSIGDAGARAIAEKLTTLTTLDIRYNSIGEADVIRDLLQRLIPKEDGGQPGGRLQRIWIEKNPLAVGREPIDLSGFTGSVSPIDLLIYLNEVLSEDTIPLPEARVVLIGVGRNGKSQLARALSGRYKPGDKVDQNDRTKGVDVETMSLDTSKHGKVDIRLFDCGGQPEQYQIHRIFWESLRNMMVLVIDGTKPWDFSGNRGDYFLRMIEAEFTQVRHERRDTGEKPPPVLIVVTKADEMAKSANTEHHTTPEQIVEITRDYKLDVHVVPEAVDAVNQVGLDVVKNHLTQVLDKTSGLDAQLPASFGKVREAVQGQFGTWEQPKDDVHGMDLRAYQELCEGADQKDKGQQLIYLRILAAVGDVIYLPDDPMLSKIVLNIHWARKALYHILTDDTVRNEHDGIMWESDFGRLTAEMAPDLPQMLLNLSEHLGVAYEMEPQTEPISGRRERRWLIPDLLRPTNKAHLWCKKKPVVTLTYKGFLSEAVFLRFIAASRKYIRDVSKDANRDQVVLTHSDEVEVVVSPDYDGQAHAIQLWANPNDPASYQWCKALGSGLDDSQGTTLQIMGEVDVDSTSNKHHVSGSSGFVINNPVFKMESGSRLDITKEIEAMVDNSIHMRDNYGQVAQIMTQCTNTINQHAPDDRKDLLEQLHREVSELVEKLPDDKKDQVAEDFESMVKETVKPKPRRKWYSLSAEGLLEASKFTKDFTGNIAGTLLNLGKKIWGADFTLPEV